MSTYNLHRTVQVPPEHSTDAIHRLQRRRAVLDQDYIRTRDNIARVATQAGEAAEAQYYSLAQTLNDVIESLRDAKADLPIG